MSELWPTFFVVGAHKSGTTSLYKYLRGCQGVFMSGFKEPHYFSPQLRSSGGRAIVRDQKQYLALFRDATNNDVIGEASVFYLWDPESASIIHSKLPNSKIIIILRDPIERAFSHYLDIVRVLQGRGESPLPLTNYLMRNSSETKVFDHTYLLVELGYYYEQVKRYFDVFGRDSVNVLIFEEFFKDPINQFRLLLNFLNVDTNLPSAVGEKFNPYTVPKNKVILSLANNSLSKKIKEVLPHSVKALLSPYFYTPSEKPKMDESSREYLAEKYSCNIKELEKLLGKHLPWQNVS